MTRLVLVNAVYFKAQWLQPFNSEDTKLQKFHISRNEEVDIPMMHMKTFFGFKHSDHLEARILELPYEVRVLCTHECKILLRTVCSLPYTHIIIIIKKKVHHYIRNVGCL
jgi:hypothetical protein